MYWVFLCAIAGTAKWRFSHRNSVCSSVYLFIHPSVHTGGSVENSATGCLEDLGFGIFEVFP